MVDIKDIVDKFKKKYHPSKIVLTNLYDQSHTITLKPLHDLGNTPSLAHNCKVNNLANYNNITPSLKFLAIKELAGIQEKFTSIA